MIPHDRALVIVRVKPKDRKRWVRSVVRDRIKAKQAENVAKIHAMHRATQLQDAVDTCVDLLGAEVIEVESNGVSAR